jgi:hypothetical protein
MDLTYRQRVERLAAIQKRIDAASDAINGKLESIEADLRETGIHVEAWVPILETTTAGWTRLSGGDWGLFVKTEHLTIRATMASLRERRAVAVLETINLLLDELAARAEEIVTTLEGK